MQDWTGTDSVYHIIDRLLFVLMLVEILHTVHASIRSGTLLCEPFLIVGLIACIRRILVITLETSQITQPERWDRQPVDVSRLDDRTRRAGGADRGAGRRHLGHVPHCAPHGADPEGT